MKVNLVKACVLQIRKLRPGGGEYIAGNLHEKMAGVKPDSRLPVLKPMNGKNTVAVVAALVTQTGSCGLAGLYKDLGIPNFHASPRWFLRSSKFGKHFCISGASLTWDAVLSWQFLLLHWGAFQGLEEGRDHIQTPTSSLLCGMFQWKQVLC